MTAEQQTAFHHYQLWLAAASDLSDKPEIREACLQRAIRNLMVASHAR